MNHTIEWQEPDGTDAVEIAGTTDSVGDFAVDGQQLVQVAQGVRAASSRPINRRNVGVRVSFTVRYEPAASPLAAETDIVSRTAALVAATATRSLLEGVFSTLTWQLADAALESFRFSQVGTTVIGQFIFVGGAFTDESA